MIDWTISASDLIGYFGLLAVVGWRVYVAVRKRIERFETTLNGHTAAITAHDERLDRHEDRLELVGRQMEKYEERLMAVAARMDDHQNRLLRVAERLETGILRRDNAGRTAAPRDPRWVPPEGDR